MFWKGKKVTVIKGISEGETYTIVSEPVEEIKDTEYVICRDSKGSEFPIEVAEIEKGKYYSLNSSEDVSNLQLLTECKNFFKEAFFNSPYPTINEVVVVLREREYPEAIIMQAVYACLKERQYSPDNK